jgi:hypothetical protein
MSAFATAPGVCAAGVRLIRLSGSGKGRVGLTEHTGKHYLNSAMVVKGLATPVIEILGG